MQQRCHDRTRLAQSRFRRTALHDFSFSGLDESFLCVLLRIIDAKPAETAGNLRACLAQLVADDEAPPLLRESADGPRYVDRAERHSGKIENRHRRRADATFEMGLAPSDAGTAILLGFGAQR